MPTTISQAFELPDPTDIRAMGFVVKLRDESTVSDAARQLVRDYVITPAVRKELPLILEELQAVHTRREDYGRIIHGSFGSGKSHLMHFLSLLLEDKAAAWDKDDPLMSTLGTQRAWIESARLLVVRIHMLSKRGQDTGLDRIVYESFNDALRVRNKQPFQFLNVDGVIEEMRREAQLYGHAFWTQVATANVVPDAESFELLATSDEAEDREELARAYLAFKGRSADSAGIHPAWAQGLHRMSSHARDQGFDGIVLMVDELLLWLAEKDGQQFAAEINNLNVIVDHDTGERAVPVFVFLARQRNLKEFFPDYAAEDHIHEHLDHHAKRFEKTELQDVELRHIVKGRVLRPRLPEEVGQAVAALSERHRSVLPELLRGADVSYIRDVYPFHPALIEMLVDVTNLMQRERSALRLLFELLVLHNPELSLGEFLPVGRAFDAIFPKSGVEASRQADKLQRIHREYHHRLCLALDQLVDTSDDKDPFSRERRDALDQLVKTVLLGEVSPRLRGSGLTVEQLVQLNSADVTGDLYRTKVRVAEQDLRRLIREVPQLQITGKQRTAVVRYVLGGADLGELLKRAAVKTQSRTLQLTTFYSVLKPLLGIEGRRGFRPGEDNVGEQPLTWRGTKRKGRLLLGNVRLQAYEAFKAPPGGFLVMVDYPWDDPGHTVDEDRLRTRNVARAEGNQYTACWLPRHFSSDEQKVVHALAAVRYLRSDAGQQELLDELGSADRQQVLEQARHREISLQQDLERTIKVAYCDHGEVSALISDVESSLQGQDLQANLNRLSTTLMDRRYKAHPRFKVEPTARRLGLLLRWMESAGESGVSVHFDDETGRVLEDLGEPLELVNLGQSRASLRQDSRYLKDVLQRVDAETASWDAISDDLRRRYGFQDAVLDLFVCFVCSRGYRALHATTGAILDPAIGSASRTPTRLERARLLDQAAWSRARELGTELFATLNKPSSHRSLKVQDRWGQALREQAGLQRGELQGLHELLVEQLDVQSDSKRLQDVRECQTRLRPLVLEGSDSFARLEALLAQWPDESDDPLRKVVKDTGRTRRAAAAISRAARDQLHAGRSHPEHSAEVEAHLGALTECLESTDQARPLTPAWVED